jgi:hypothetical protein
MDASTRRRAGRTWPTRGPFSYRARAERLSRAHLLRALAACATLLGLFASPAADAVITQGKVYETGVVALACPTVQQCTATAGIKGEPHPGQVVTFDPLSPGAPAVQTLDAGEDLFALSCPSTSQCTTGDIGGRELTFDPSNPGTPEPVGLESGIIESVSCPSVTQCTTGDSGGNATTFDPTAPGKPKAIAVDAGIENLLHLDCVSLTQCTAASRSGRVTTFDPQAPGTTAPFDIDPGTELGRVSCPTSEQCTTLNAEGVEITFDPLAPEHATSSAVGGGRHLIDLACPAITQCTAVGDYGTEVTFDPALPGSAILVQIAVGTFPQEHRNLNAIACPSTHQCTTVDDAGVELTFDPTAERAPPARLFDTLPGTQPPAHIEPAPIGPAQIRALLARMLRPSGRQARLGAILKSGGYSFRLTTLEPGTTNIAWYLAPGVGGRQAKPSRKRAPILIARGRSISIAAGTKTAKLMLTRSGRQRLRESRRLKLAAEASFTPSGAAAVKTSQTFTLTH